MACAVGSYNFVIVEFQHRAIKNECQCCNQVCPDSRQKDTRDDDDDGVEKIERAIPASRLVYDKAHKNQVGENLQRSLQTMFAPVAKKFGIEKRNHEPGSNRADEKTERQSGRREVRHGQLNSQQKSQNQ